MFFTKRSFARDRQTWIRFAIMAIVNTAIPFVLISWGETKIDSGLASILNGTVPLFTIVIAHFWLHDEKISFGRLLGLIIGFIGVIVLVSRDIGPQGMQGNILGQLAVLFAAISYAVGITFSRRHLRGQNPLLQAASTLLVADTAMWLITPAIEHPLVLPQLPITWLAIVWLGLLGTCAGYLLYFTLINAWGATRASLVSYVFPVIGLILGIVFLHEQLDWRLWVGSALVIVSVLAVNFNQLFRSAPAIAPAPASE